ncbi:GmrSD restriction endonuclease domain-containing protein [Microbacterium aurum]
MPQHLTVPIYQRPYVWSEDEQWAPLWADVRRIAEHRLDNAGSSATHFLGAVVTQQAEARPVGVQEFLIVDGQQRLTTLQLLIDAVAAEFTARGLSDLAAQLEFLTHNGSMFVGAETGLKLRHSNRDRAAFDEVMHADPPVDYAALKHGDSLIVRGHEYFSRQIGPWLGSGEAASARAQALAVALQNALQLVVIQLTADEDSQEIFETLNARGTPLTAADLIKNFVFQRLKLEGEDEHEVYRESWPFETKFWEAEVSVGRFSTTRSAVFLSQWLVSRVGKEISPRSTFARFKFFVEHESASTMVELLSEIAAQASDYEQLTARASDAHADLSRVELHFARMAVAQVEITKPVVIWLREPGTPYSQATADAVVAMVESVIIRRRLLRLTSSDLNRVMSDLIARCRGVGDAELASVASSYLAGQQVASTYWPGDTEVRATLRTAAFYWRYSRPMARLFLQAIEDAYRGYAGEGPSKTGVRVPRVTQQIEHVLPQSWRAHWPVAGPVEAAERDEHVQRLGNLTLLTGSLNAAVSNAAWLGSGGKRDALRKHETMLMNRELVDSNNSGWDENRIDARTEYMVSLLLQTWPAPEGHEGKVVDRTVRVSKATAKYSGLIDAGLLKVGAELVCTDSRWPDARATVLAGARVLYDGVMYESPAAAARIVRGGSGNAWYFWRVGQEGPLLTELRDQLLRSATDA